MLKVIKFVFFGSSEFSVLVLDELKERGLLPTLVVTTPDKPKGRKLIMTPNGVKVWASKHGIEVLDPKNLKDNPELVSKLKALSSQLFLVAAYGKILKKEIFDIPKFKTLNIHPSLLPKYRGASPMISQILNNAGGPESSEGMGTSIMVIDEGVDTGPVVGQRKIPHPGLRLGPLLGKERESKGEVFSIFELEKIMAKESAELLVEILPDYVAGKIEPKPQEDGKATYSEKIKKEDGLLDLESDPIGNLLKIKAFARWPRAYYFQDGKRIVVTDARLDDAGNLDILKVIPEGKNEMPFGDFLRGQKN